MYFLCLWCRCSFARHVYDSLTLVVFLVHTAAPVLLTSAGAATGVAIGHAGAFAVHLAYPDFPIAVPWWGTLSALLTSVAFGLAFGVIPARRAARLDPVHALSNRG